MDIIVRTEACGQVIALTPVTASIAGTR